LAYNRPIVNIEKGLLRKGKNSLLVKAIMDDGSWVLREKSKDGKINKYIVYDDIIAKDNGGPLELNAFGSNTPIEVSRILGMAPITLSKTDNIEINISSQNEDAFMLSQSSPEIARWIYSITHLEEIHLAIDEINRDVRKCNEQIKDYDKRINQLQEKIEEFDNLKTHEEKFIELELNDILLSTDLNRLEELSQLYDSMIETKNKAKPIQNRIATLEDILSHITDEQILNIQNDLIRVNELIILDSNIENCNNKIKTINEKIQYLDQAVMIDILDLDNDLSKLKSIMDLLYALSNINEKIKKENNFIKISEENISNIDTKISNIKTKLFGDSSNPRCPICSSIIDKDLIEHIIEELNHEQSK